VVAADTLRLRHVKGLSGYYTRTKAESGCYEVHVNGRRVGIVRKMSHQWYASRGGAVAPEPFMLLHRATDWCATPALEAALRGDK
jgi:hypothetical protein